LIDMIKAKIIPFSHMLNDSFEMLCKNN
jgi:hypothetical protein